MANSRTVCILVKPKVYAVICEVRSLEPPVIVAIGSVQRIARCGRADGLRFELDQGETSGKAGADDQQRSGAEPPPAARFGSDTSVHACATSTRTPVVVRAVSRACSQSQALRRAGELTATSRSPSSSYVFSWRSPLAKPASLSAGFRVKIFATIPKGQLN